MVNVFESIIKLGGGSKHSLLSFAIMVDFIMKVFTCNVNNSKITCSHMIIVWKKYNWQSYTKILPIFEFTLGWDFLLVGESGIHHNLN